MQPRIIHVRIDDVHAELKRVMSRLDEFPTPAQVGEHDGPQGQYVDSFNWFLADALQAARRATESVITELADVDSTVRAALDDLTSQDEELAESAERIEAYVDSAVQQSESTPSPDGPPVPAAGTGDSGKVDLGDYGPGGAPA